MECTVAAGPCPLFQPPAHRNAAPPAAIGSLRHVRVPSRGGGGSRGKFPAGRGGCRYRRGRGEAVPLPGHNRHRDGAERRGRSSDEAVGSGEEGVVSGGAITPRPVLGPGRMRGKRGAGDGRDPLPVLPLCRGAGGSRPGPLVSLRQAPRLPSTCWAASPAKNTPRQQLVSVGVEPQSRRCTGMAP